MRFNNFGFKQTDDEQNKKMKTLIKLIKENDDISLDNQINKDIYLESNFTLDINQKDDQKEERDDNLINDRVSLLHAAAYYDSLECFVYLQNQKQMNIRKLSTKSFLPLHYACYNSSREVAAYILSTDPKQVEIPNDNSLFCFTIIGGDVTILNELFHRGGVIQKSKTDDPLEKAIAFNDIELCMILLKHYKGYSESSNPALTAAEMCNPELLGFLVKSPFDLQYSKELNESVFSLIFKFSDGSEFKDLIVDWLTKFGNLIIDMPKELSGVDGVVQWICKLGDPYVAQLMVNTEDVSINRIGANNHVGPYYLASNKKLSEDVIIKILSILIDKGFDLNYQNDNPKLESVLEIFVNSIFSIKYKVIKFLLENGANPYVPFSKNNSITIFDFIKKKNERINQIFTDYLNENK